MSQCPFAEHIGLFLFFLFFFSVVWLAIQVKVAVVFQKFHPREPRTLLKLKVRELNQ